MAELFSLLLVFALGGMTMAVWAYLVELAGRRLFMLIWFHSYRLDAWVERMLVDDPSQWRFNSPR